MKTEEGRFRWGSAQELLSMNRALKELDISMTPGSKDPWKFHAENGGFNGN